MFVRDDSSTILTWLKDIAKNEIENKTPCQESRQFLPPAGMPAAGILVYFSQCYIVALAHKIPQEKSETKNANIMFLATSPGNSLDTELMNSMIPYTFVRTIVGYVAKMFLGGHTAIQGSLPNLVACTCDDVPNGSFIGPHYKTYGLPSLILTDAKDSEDSSQWKAIVGQEAIEIGEIILEGATTKTKLNIPL